jgi:hypothetical protein
MDDQLLIELRGMRSDLLGHAERLSAIETLLHSIAGNGQPGRLTTLESKVSRLIEWKYWLMGAAAGLGIAGGLIERVLFHN